MGTGKTIRIGSARLRTETSIPSGPLTPILLLTPVKLAAAAVAAENGCTAAYATEPSGTFGRAGIIAPPIAKGASASRRLKDKVKFPLVKVALLAPGFVAKNPAARRSSGGNPKFVSKAATVSAVKLVSGILLMASAAEISVVVGVGLTVGLTLIVAEVLVDELAVGLTLMVAEVLIDGLVVKDDEGVTVRVALVLILVLALTLALALDEGETELLEVNVALGLVLRPEVGLTVLAGL